MGFSPESGTIIRNRILIILAATALLYGQKSKEPARKDNPGDWPMYTRDLAGTRYSPLKQITAANISKLTAAWNYKLRGGAPTAGGGEGAAEAPALKPPRSLSME